MTFKCFGISGLFSEGHIPYIDERIPNYHPDLKTMATKALEILQNIGTQNGFFLMVEGARIDMGHHENWASRALHETLEFDDTIEEIMRKVNLEETLIIGQVNH